MKIGFNAPVQGPLSAPEEMARICAEGEALGYDYAAFSDHVIIPADIQARYPYSESGEFLTGERISRHEQLTAMAFIAAKTSRLHLVTSVMVVPHRPAVLAAKMLSTIDVLSGGRVAVGIGAGWMQEEFEALGTPPFAARGAVTDEYIKAFRALWTEDRPGFAGEHVSFSNMLFEPKPVRNRHIPIWVGGESGPALRRTARLGDAWYPIGTNPAHPLDSLPRYQAGIARLHKAAREAGRNPADIGLIYRVAQHGAALPAQAGDGERRLFSGSAADVAGDVRALRELGVSHVDFGFDGATAGDVLAEMQRFRTEVLAKV